MKLQRTIAFLTAMGLIPLATLSLSACTSTRQSSPSESSDTVSATPSMPHESNMNMEGMDHGMMQMDLGPKDENFDLRFIDGMIPHHEGAVAMAEQALEHSDREEIRQLAQAIIEAQETEIAQMQQWRQEWYPNTDATPMMYDTQMGHMMPMSEEMRSSMMMDVDLGSADVEFDLRFIDAMIPHHEGALTMAEQALEKSDRSDIQNLSQNILSSQQAEIEQMQQWRQEWYGQ